MRRVCRGYVKGVQSVCLGYEKVCIGYEKGMYRVCIGYVEGL